MANYLDEAGLAELWSLIQDADAATLAEAIATAAKVYEGSYTGTGSTTKTFAFDYPAKILCVSQQAGEENIYQHLFFKEMNIEIHARLYNGSILYDNAIYKVSDRFDGYNLNSAVSNHVNVSGITYDYWALA